MHACFPIDKYCKREPYIIMYIYCILRNCDRNEQSGIVDLLAMLIMLTVKSVIMGNTTGNRTI